MARPSHYHTTSGLTAMPSMPAFQRGHSVWGYPGPSGALTRKRKQPQGSPAGELVSLHLYTGGPVPPAFGSASVYPRKWDARASRACAEFFLNSRPPKHAHHQREKLIWERERQDTRILCTQDSGTKKWKDSGPSFQSPLYLKLVNLPPLSSPLPPTPRFSSCFWLCVLNWFDKSYDSAF